MKVYFEIRKGDELIPDLEGAEFEDLAEAKKEAEVSLHEIVGEDIANAVPLVPRSITIRDENGNELATIEVKAAVKMVQETRT